MASEVTRAAHRVWAGDRLSLSGMAGSAGIRAPTNFRPRGKGNLPLRVAGLALCHPTYFSVSLLPPRTPFSLPAFTACPPRGSAAPFSLVHPSARCSRRRRKRLPSPPARSAHSPRIRSPQTSSWTLTPGAPSPSQETHPGRGQERGAPPRRSGVRVRNPGVARGCEGTPEAAAKVPAAAAARRERAADTSRVGPPYSQKPKSEQPLSLPWVGGDTAVRAVLLAGAARAWGGAGGSAAVAALCASLGR